jgi:large subunit ribosomal protein L30
VATLSITWKKSFIGYRKDQRATIRSLGFRRLNQTVTHPDTPIVRGMVNKVIHLVKIETIDE